MLGWGAAYVPSAWLVEDWPPLIAAGARLTVAGLAAVLANTGDAPAAEVSAWFLVPVVGWRPPGRCSARPPSSAWRWGWWGVCAGLWLVWPRAAGPRGGW